MSLRVAINGFGRIGRMVLRAIVESQKEEIEVVAVNDLADGNVLAHLLKYDSIHGRFPVEVTYDNNKMQVGKRNIALFSERSPENLPWGDLNVDIVMECSGFFLTAELAGKHLKAGAKRVLLSAPSKDDTKIVVYGINHQSICADDKIISNASCTTNALAPLLAPLHKSFGIETGFMTTIHAYTGDQPSHDSVHKDLYRGRASALSMVPTSTGAAKAIGRVIPDLDGRLNGVALRVPVPNVSAIDITLILNKQATKEEICNLLEAQSKGQLKGILGYEKDKLVSSDLNHSSHSSTFIEDQLYIQNEKLVRVFSWYDNEWGFSNRMIDTAQVMGKTL